MFYRRLRPGVRVQLYVAYGFKDSVLRIPYGGYYKGPGEYTLFVARGSDALERRNCARCLWWDCRAGQRC